jgi:hypothetical protein
MAVGFVAHDAINLGGDNDDFTAGTQVAAPEELPGIDF